MSHSRRVWAQRSRTAFNRPRFMAGGYVSTNGRIIQRATSIFTVGLGNGRRVPGKLVGADQPTDVAVLQVNSDHLAAMPLAQFRASSRSATSWSRSATRSGFADRHLGNRQRSRRAPVSASKTTRTSSRPTPRSTRATRVARLVDLRGELVGINSAILSGAGGNIGIGFAIPINMVRTSWISSSLTAR